MPIKYVILSFNGDRIDANLVKVLISRLTKLEKLQIDKLHAMETVGSQQWNHALWSQQKYTKK
jgi:hypothetical protein